MNTTCEFDSALGGPAHYSRCKNPSVANCKTRDLHSKGVKRVCEDHLMVYKPKPHYPRPYIVWYERDVYEVIEDHDSGDEG